MYEFYVRLFLYFIYLPSPFFLIAVYISDLEAVTFLFDLSVFILTVQNTQKERDKKNFVKLPNIN